jgi:L-aminopeptidase/D-esterase-like protein
LAAAALLGAGARAEAPQRPTPSGLVPRVDFEGRALEFDFPALRVGVAEYDEGPTGATVFHFPEPVMATVDVRGGAPGTVNTDVIRLAYESAFVNAICFAGGSAYGLAAASGVAAEIKDRTPEAGRWERIAVVPGAIIFDLGNRRFSTVTPDEALGRAALRAAQPGRLPLGARGAGRFAMQGAYFGDRQYSGQGAAYARFGPTKVLAFSVVNAVGHVVDRRGQVVRCSRPAEAGCGPIADKLAEIARRSQGAATEGGAGAGPSAHTTVSLVVTNQKLPAWALQRLAAQVHTSLARAIQPLATEDDGDTLFAATTGEVENPDLSASQLAVLASEAAWDAVLASVPERPPAGPTTPVTVAGPALDACVGDYEFAPGVRARVRREAAGLAVELGDHESLYLPRRTPVELTPVGPDEFVLRTLRGDRVRFQREAGRPASGLVINPGPWAVPARRVAAAP